MKEINHGCFTAIQRERAILGLKRKRVLEGVPPEIRSVMKWLEEKELEDLKSSCKGF